MENNIVTSPKHYKLKDGTELIDVLDILDVSKNLDRAVEYIVRSDKKNGSDDLLKALFYLVREIAQKYPDLDVQELLRVVSESSDMVKTS